MENIYHYNQAGSDDDIIQSFIARHDVLDVLTRRLSSVEDDGVAVHHVLIGSRGMGKTSLLMRLAVEVDRDPELSARFVALRFREEQYNVLNLASFWRNCMESLAEWAEKSGLDDLADRLDEIASGNHCQDDDTAEECFEAEMVALGRRAVLLIDNLDLILSALPKESNWKLRRVLQSKAGPIVVGAASQALKATANRDAAFYEFFQPHYLNPLDLAETRDCMLTLASRRGPKGKAVQLVVRSQPERLQTLHALTGGNPRVISLIYRLLESSDTHEVMSDLNALLDDVTPYYKHKIEEYSSTQQRAVIDAISLNWDPVTTGDLSKITGIKSTTISPILVKLRKDGMIENVEVSGSYAGHQIVERFFNIWYLMRHGTRRTKQKMRWLVGFFTSFYSPKELMQLSSKFDRKKGVDLSVHPEYASALREALACEGHFFDESRRQTLVNEWAEGEADISSAGRFEKSDETSIPELFKPVWEANETGRNRKILDEISKLPHALDELEQVANKEYVGRLFNIKGNALCGLKDYRAALTIYDALVARYGDDDADSVRGRAAAAMFNKGLAQNESGDLEAALATYDALVARYGDDDADSVRVVVAKAMFSKGLALDKRGDLEAALTTYDALLERYGDDEADSVREAAARAMQIKGRALDKSGDLEAALTAYDALIERYGDDEAGGVRVAAASAMVSKGLALAKSGDLEAELTAYDALVARYGDDDAGSVREAAARAMFSKGLALDKRGDLEAALTTYDALLERYGDDEADSVREAAARAMANKGRALDKSGDLEAALTAYDALIERYGDDDADSVQEEVASARIRSANGLIQKGIEFERATSLFRKAMPLRPLLARANLVWLHLLNEDDQLAEDTLQKLDELPPFGKALMSAAFELRRDNFGSAMKLFEEVVRGELDEGDWNFEDDIERFLLIAKQKGFGERLVSWFEDSRLSEKVAPLFVAIKGFVGGEELLKDANPEVRGLATQIYERLVTFERNFQK